MNIEQLTGEDIVATELPRKFNGNFANVKQEVESHINNKNNPHKVTAEQLGLASAYIYQGDVETFQNLPTQGVQKGWVYNVKAEFTLEGAPYPAGTDVVWDGTKWNTLGGSLKGYIRTVNNVAPANNSNVNVKKLIATQLVNGQDLNDVKTEGRYKCAEDSVAATLLNAPLRTAFYLDVYVNSSTQVKQVITANTAEMKIFMRTLVNGAWSGWQRVQFVTGVHDIQEIKNSANTPIKLTGSFSHKYNEIAGGNIDLVSNIDVYWVTPATSDTGVTINLSNLTKQSGYSRFITLYVDGSKCPDLRTITYTNKPSGFTLMNEPERMMGGMVNVIGIEIVGTGNIYTITNNGSGEGAKQNFEFFNSLQQIGITPGEETFASIHSALPINSVLEYYAVPNSNFNDDMYPITNYYGVLQAIKLGSASTIFSFYNHYAASGNEFSILYLSAYDSNFSDSRTAVWKRVANVDDISKITSNNVTTGDELNNLKGNCFFSTNITDGSIPELNDIDSAGISMRNAYQAFQLFFEGDRIKFRQDGSYRTGDTATPNYSNFYEVLTSLHSGWTVSKGTNGWARENSTGFTIQWGIGSGSDNADEKQVGPYTFPRTFTNCYIVNATLRNADNRNPTDYDCNFQPRTWDNKQFYLYQQSYGGVIWFSQFVWFAIGVS